MVKWTRFPVCIVSKQLVLFAYSGFITNVTFRQVCYYSTAATDEAAYIIGGFQRNEGSSHYSPTIAEFKNDQWRKLGDLMQGREVHGSISIGHQTMIVGGYTSSG